MTFTVKEIQSMLDGEVIQKDGKWYCVYNNTLLVMLVNDGIWEVLSC